MKTAINEAITLEQADGPWKFSECFKSGPLKIRRRFLLAIGRPIPKSDDFEHRLNVLFRITSNAATEWY